MGDKYGVMHPVNPLWNKSSYDAGVTGARSTVPHAHGLQADFA